MELRWDLFDPSRYRTVHRCSLCADGGPTCSMTCLELPKEMIVTVHSRLAVPQA